MKVNKHIAISVIPKLTDVPVIYDNVSVYILHPDILCCECYYNDYGQFGNEMRMYYLVCENEVIPCKKGGNAYKNQRIISNEYYELWESFLNNDGKVNDNIVNSIICIVENKYIDTSFCYEAKKTIVYIVDNKKLLADTLQKIIDNEKQKIANLIHLNNLYKKEEI